MTKDYCVLMSVYSKENAEFLRLALMSMLTQTVPPRQLVLVADGGLTPALDEVIKDICGIYPDTMEVVRLPENRGLANALNMGLAHCRYELIARMDSDDVSLPMRLETQYQYMESNPNVIMCGSRVSFLGNQKGISDAIRHKERENTDDYRVRLLLAHPGPHHPTFFMRHEMLKMHGITYDETLRCAQDYGLCTELSRYGDIVVLDDALVCYRTHDGQISSAHRDKQIRCDKMVKKKLLKELLGDVSDEEVDFHYHYFSGNYPEAKITPDLARWSKRLLTANSQLKIYDQKKLRQHIERIERWLLMNTFTAKMSLPEKMLLALHYVSPVSALKLLIEIRAQGH